MTAGQILSLVFVAAWLVGITSWFLAVAESIGMWRFSRWVFRIGFTVHSEDRVMRRPAAAGTESIETANGMFRFVSPDECLFRSKYRVFGFRIHTPFPLKGSIRWSGDRASITARTPVFTVVFMAAWLVGWTVGSLTAMASGSGSAVTHLPFLLFGVAMVGGMTAFSLPLERRRLLSLIGELEDFLRSSSAGRSSITH